jgi:hypothetical protein
MLRRLRLTLSRKGKLSSSIINNTAGLPSVECYVKHFGSIRKVYALIGYEGSRDCEWFDARHHWSEVLSKLAARVADALRIDRPQVGLADDGHALTLNGRRKIVAFQAVRQMVKRDASHAAAWRAHRAKPGAELLVVLRLNHANKEIKDYVLVPAPDDAKQYLTLSDASLARQKAVRVKTRGRTNRRDQSEIHIVQPCRASQANATEKPQETKSAKTIGRSRQS